MLTPIDIQNHSLKTAVRGYSKKETDDFLEEILEGYEELYKENRELKEKISSLSEGIQYYKQMETTLQKALVLAEKTSTETQEAAKSRAEAMTGEAQAKADAILKEAQSEADAMRKEVQAYSDITKSKANRELEDTRNHVRKLVQSYENYRLQFKKLAESQIEMLESEHFSIFAPELAEMLDDAPDADTVMESERNVPINASDDYYEEVAETAENPENLKNDESNLDMEDSAVEISEEVKEENEAVEEAASSQEGVVVDDVEDTLEDDTEDTVYSEESVAEKDTIDSDKSETDNAEETAESEITVSSDVSETESTEQTDVKNSEEDSADWEQTTPKLEDYNEIEVSKTVTPEPQEDTPFTFIDTE